MKMGSAMIGMDSCGKLDSCVCRTQGAESLPQ